MTSSSLSPFYFIKPLSKNGMYTKVLANMQKYAAASGHSSIVKKISHQKYSPKKIICFSQIHRRLTKFCDILFLGIVSKLRF